MEAEQFFDLLCTLEGYKVKFRELHWNASLLSDHKLCDSIMDSITEFQDNFAEEGFTIFGKFESETFSPIQQYGETTVEVLKQLLEVIFYNKNLLNKVELCSLSNLCDDFIHTIRKSITLTDYK